MSFTDPLADMFTRIRNASRAHFDKVEIPSSKMKEAIAAIFKREGYIADYEIIPDNKQNLLRVRLKYFDDKTCAITNIRRVSRPSMRVYLHTNEIKPVRRFAGISILSTTEGILTDRDARNRGLGGELLCEVW